MNCKKIFPKDPIFDCKIILTFLWSLKTVKIATRGPQNIVWNTLQIDTLKYLEIRIEKWPSRANLDQVRSSGAKQGLTGKILTKCGQMEPNRPNGLIFCMQAYFYERKISYLASQALKQKWAKL